MVAWPNRSRVDRKPIRLCRLGRSTYAHFGRRYHTRADSASDSHTAAALYAGANIYTITYAHVCPNCDIHCDAHCHTDSDDPAASAIVWRVRRLS